MNEEKRKIWKERIQEFRNSGGTQTQFARQLGVHLRTFQYWNTKFKREPNLIASREWLEVKRPEPVSKAAPIILEINGVRIALMEDFNPEFLKNVIRTLKQS